MISSNRNYFFLIPFNINIIKYHYFNFIEINRYTRARRRILNSDFNEDTESLVFNQFHQGLYFIYTFYVFYTDIRLMEHETLTRPSADGLRPGRKRP